MKKRILLAFMVLLPAFLFSQTKYASYNWNTFPPEKNQDTVKSVNGSLILLERTIKEIYLNKENLFEEIDVFHRKIRVDNSAAISRHNKIYVPTSNAIEILAIKARFISSSGKITELTKDNIRQIENLENKGDFSTFAIEGAEAGGQIEYFYILKKKFTPFETVIKQDNLPRTNVDVILSYPSKLVFLTKNYNGFPAFSTITDSTGITEQHAYSSYIPAQEDEKYSFYEANLQRYEYTLAYNYYNSTFRVYSWNKVADRLYEINYIFSKKETNAVNDWLHSMNLDMTNKEAVVREVEKKIKSEISILESADREMALDEVIKTKKASKRNITRLFIALLTNANIDFNLVYTTDKEKHPFDPDFNGWNFVDKAILYFPGMEKYIIPDEETHRLGPLPSSYQENYGMFLHPVSFQDKLKTLGYEIRYIPAVIRNSITDSLLIKLFADPLKPSLTADVYRVFSKDLATGFQAWWHLWDESRKKEIINSIFGMGDPNARIQNMEILHNMPDDIGLYPLIWKIKINSDALMELAGQDVLIKIGESIGPQVELYQTSVRKLPISISDLHNYYRKIELEIPAGYHLGDISSLKMNVTMMNNGKPSCFFTSDAVIQGNLLIIISEERYTESYYPKERFEEFRKVINASADFNKRTVLLEKNP